MKVAVLQAGKSPVARRRATAGFTITEVVVASGLALMVMASAMMFMNYAGLSMSGITGQVVANQRAGNTVEFIQSRTRLATSVSNDSSGNVLTLTFDDNPAVDSDLDGKSYNDKDHREQFKFVGVNGSTNATTTNSLVYVPNTASNLTQVLIPTGVRNLPGYKIFSVTNQATVIICFGVSDNYGRDRYQSVDIQSTAVPLNRPSTTNLITILP